MNIIFDVTDLRNFIQHSNTLTGIQRVVMMTLIESQDQLKEVTIWMGFYDHSQSGYRCVRLPDNIRETFNDPLLLRKALNIKGSALRPAKLRRYEDSFIKKYYHTKRLDLAAFRDKSKPFKKYGMTPRDWKKIRSIEKHTEGSNLRPNLALEKIINKNDKIVLIDNILQHDRIFPHLIRAKSQGCQILTFVHDLIPIIEPWFVSADGSARFYRSLKESTKFTSLYITNSRNTLKDLDVFMKSQSLDIKRKAIPLAQQKLVQSKERKDLFNDLEHEVLSAFASSYGISPRIKSLAKSPFVLVVGTKEVRKNLWRVATAWDALRKQKVSDTPKLVIVGKQGWSNDDFENLLKGTGSLGGWLEVVENASDVELDWLYERCLFTIFASMYEGWGLPVGESLGHGKTAVVSRTSSMPEVGMDMVEYCDPYDLESIYESCLRLVSDRSHRISLEDKIAETQLRKWSDFTFEMSETIKNLQ